MKLFQTVQRVFCSLGVNLKLEQFNSTFWKYFVINFLVYVFEWIFLSHESNKSLEYMESAYYISTFTSTFGSFMSIIFAREELFSIFDSVEKLYDESK